MGINDPALLAGQGSISVAKIMARATQRSKKLIATQPLSHASCFVVDVLAFGLLASFAHLVESQVGLFNLCILLVFTLALGGCAPQPSAALESLRSFQWSF